MSIMANDRIISTLRERFGDMLTCRQMEDVLQPDGVRFMLRELGKRTGVKHVHPHKFRRTEITELVNRGMPIEQVATLMGHEKLDTTMGYIVTNQFNVRNSYQKYA